MSSRLALPLIAALGLCSLPALGHAAPSKKAKPSPAPAKEAEDAEAATPAEAAKPEPPAPPTDLDGADEDPEAPEEFDAPPPPVAKAQPKRRPEGYPIEEVWRPLTLPRLVTEVSLDTRFTFGPFVNGIALRGRFGITPQVQVGLAYNIGGIYDDGNRSTAFNTGKAVALTGAYQVKEWIAAQIAVPIYLEPFAASVTLGAPMKFRFAGRYALVLAEDLIDLRLTKFVPSLTSEKENEANAANIANNTTTLRGAFRFSGAGVYQHKPDLAFIGRLAVSIVDFDSQKLGYLLKVGAQKTLRKTIDLSATMGFDDLGNADETFGFVFAAAYRI
ncbi:MAG: hypothetical protein R3B48_05850 [Kofleriaceae bacterium]